MLEFRADFISKITSSSVVSNTKHLEKRSKEVSNVIGLQLQFGEGIEARVAFRGDKINQTRIGTAGSAGKSGKTIGKP